jgi:hypothetical protein
LIKAKALQLENKQERESEGRGKKRNIYKREKFLNDYMVDLTFTNQSFLAKIDKYKFFYQAIVLSSLKAILDT